MFTCGFYDWTSEVVENNPGSEFPHVHIPRSIPTTSRTTATPQSRVSDPNEQLYFMYSILLLRTEINRPWRGRGHLPTRALLSICKANASLGPCVFHLFILALPSFSVLLFILWKYSSDNSLCSNGCDLSILFVRGSSTPPVESTSRSPVERPDGQ